ncbi:MAG: cupredoxin domain-containing protein [Alphaproteobacteria bacterium]|nr:cupredoxin domain-containing protein [Alphaproteobacteria bacterium]
MIQRTMTAALIAAALSTSAMAAGAMAPMQMAATDAPNTIVMKNFDFTPMMMTVNAGTTVTWRNMDEEPHTVVSADGLFRSAALDTKETFTFKFVKAGVYKYVCSIHPKMVGTITVK